MPYRAKRGATRYNQHLARGRQHCRKIRELITRVIESGGDTNTLYLTLNAITLLTVAIDDVLTDLEAFDE